MASAALAQRIRGKQFTVAPGVFDLISARIADAQGFDCIYMTGYGAVASSLGLPDAGLATYTEMVSVVEKICAVARTPLVADGDTGYGGLLNVRHTVRGYERAGAAGIQLEDQEFPKKCGHTPGRRVVSREDMVRKIRVACEARQSEDFLIIARTDARTSLGLDEALRRMEAYAAAGADILFVESPESEDEMKRINASFDKPCMANMVEGGRTPVLTAAQLQSIGYSFAIFPSSGFLAAGAVLRDVYRVLKQHGSTAGAGLPAYEFMEFSRLMGFEDIWEFERRHPEL